MRFNKTSDGDYLSKININLPTDFLLPESMWCRVVDASSESPNLKRHCHSFFELHICIDGYCDYEIDGKVMRLEKGSLILFAPSVQHTILLESTDFKKLIWGFSVKDEVLSEILVAALKTSYTINYDKRIVGAIEIILENATEKKFGFYNVIKSQLMYIYTYVIRCFADFNDADFSCEKKYSVVAKAIKSFIYDNLDNSISFEDISAQFSKNKRLLDVICKVEYGMTLASLKKSVQFEKIKELLSETDYKLDKIAEIAGFSDRYTMGKFFKKREGTSPGEYRASLRK